MTVSLESKRRELTWPTVTLVAIGVLVFAVRAAVVLCVIACASCDHESQTPGEPARRGTAPVYETQPPEPQSEHQTESTPIDGEKVAHIQEQLSSLPVWTGSSFDDHELHAALIDQMTDIAAHDTPHIRSAVERHLNSLPQESFEDQLNYLAISHNVYVLNRILFEVPATIRSNQAKSFGGPAPASGSDALISGPNTPEGEFDMLWPLRKNDDGTFRIIGVSLFHTGPMYFALDEFDAFAAHYGRRELKAR